MGDEGYSYLRGLVKMWMAVLCVTGCSYVTRNRLKVMSGVFSGPIVAMTSISLPPPPMGGNGASK